VFLKKLNAAKIEWSKEGYPSNQEYHDKYFSLNGVSESNYVFIQANKLEHRWKHWQESEFNLLETGFGSGLNFLLTLQQWQKSIDKGFLTATRCQFFSIEHRPISSTDLKTIYTLWPHLSTLSEQLIKQLPQPFPGRHQLKFYYKKQYFYLYLMYSDIDKGLDDLLFENSISINAFYLDGFSPTKNPAMWSRETLDRIAKLAHHQATLSTYTAASNINKKLSQCGFEVQKIKGYGTKREMITAVFKPSVKIKTSINSSSASLSRQHFAVIGAGLAGCITASKLAQYGAHVTVVDVADSICHGASGNEFGLAYPRLSNGFDASCTIHLTAHQYLTRELLDLKRVKFNFDGLDLLFGEDNPNSRLKATTLETLGLTEEFITYEQHNKTQKINFKSAGWINPTSLATAYLEKHFHSGKIELIFNSKITALTSVQNKWEMNGDKAFSNRLFDGIIYCGGNHTSELFRQYNFCAKPNRGQIDLYQVNAKHNRPKYPQCSSKYIIPQSENQYWVGASYDREQLDLEVNLLTTIEHQNFLMNSLNIDSCCIKHLQSRVGIRLTANDRLPLVGAVANFDNFKAWHSKHRDIPHQNRHTATTKAPLQDGLFVNIAHGSHGLLTIPILTEHLLSQILKCPSPLAYGLHKYVDPQRFIIRSLNKS